jgi:ferritin-like metal-binding protein YciE
MFGKIQNMRELFDIELWYAYDCEQKLVDKGLPTMIEKATSPELRTALSNHLEETRNHVRRLEEVFGVIGTEPKTNSNEIFDKMMSAAKDSISHIEDAGLRDTALIVNGNIVEHYEIALYGTLASFARNLGLTSAVGLLEQTLTEEKTADAKLTVLGESLARPTVRRQTA